jgi:hypothetical protein
VRMVVRVVVRVVVVRVVVVRVGGRVKNVDVLASTCIVLARGR